jgi:uncharacterized protein YkuJ
MSESKTTTTNNIEIEREGDLLRGIRYDDDDTVSVREYEDGEERTYRDGELVDVTERRDATGVYLFLTE